MIVRSTARLDSGHRGARPHVRHLIRAAAHLALLLGFDELYELGRGLIPVDRAVALRDGLAVVALEKRWRLFDEWRAQAFVLRPAPWAVDPLTLAHHTLIPLLDGVYLYGHFAGTLVFLIWLFLRRPQHFARVRDIFCVATGLTLLIYLVFPMMPPRLMGARMGLPRGDHLRDLVAPLLDGAAQHAQIGYNPYAAMPSLHIVWALIVGATLVVAGRRRAPRLLGVLYPALMLVTVAVTGNHLLLDAVGGALVVAAATGIMRLLPAFLAPRRADAAG